MPKVPLDRRECRLNLRCDLSERIAWHQKAEIRSQQLGRRVTMSDLIRWALNADGIPQVAEADLEAAPIGPMCKKCARAFRVVGDKPDPACVGCLKLKGIKP